MRSVAATPPTMLTIACDRPADLSDGVLSAGAVERLWARDRAALAVCRDRHAALLRFYQQRDAGLALMP